uniref:Uncharacterized protein n=1 Tax=Acrobeloides nanus TaxID=290746 RepID=A0A914EFG3_9BILA
MTIKTDGRKATNKTEPTTTMAVKAITLLAMTTPRNGAINTVMATNMENTTEASGAMEITTDMVKIMDIGGTVMVTMALITDNTEDITIIINHMIINRFLKNFICSLGRIFWATNKPV